MPPENIAILLIFVAFAAAEAWRHGFLRKPGQRAKDLQVELFGSLTLVVLTQPLSLLASATLARAPWRVPRSGCRFCSCCWATTSCSTPGTGSRTGFPGCTSCIAPTTMRPT
jgi:hypothetical protein